ncbi:MAG: diphosphomevalonate/mevalonate 3,5-bisphosphate decarboxylase family protein [Promethearchaeota archaeon]
MSISIPKFLINKLKKDHYEILQYLIKEGYAVEDLPKSLIAKKNVGEAITLAYPIQGILKYHGFANADDRIAYFPSISLNNACMHTVTYLNFSKSLTEDTVILEGVKQKGNSLNRVKIALNYIRKVSNVNTKALLVSRNVQKFEMMEEGKGLGTSASGSAALALAAASIIYNNESQYISNKRLISIFSRYLSGSGCRSATGGFSLWFSHPKIDPLRSYAIRLDTKKHQKFIDEISLLTIPIKSVIKTKEAHIIAPTSLFFQSWLAKRKELIFKFIEALNNNDLSTIGLLAEYDTLCLHAVTMTAPNDQYILAWDSDTLKVMHKIRELRLNGIESYYSIDTGPSLVLITHESNKKKIYDAIKPIIPHHNILSSKIGGPCKILSRESPEVKVLEDDIKKFIPK